MRWSVLWMGLLLVGSATADKVSPDAECDLEGRVVEIESGDTLLIEISAGRIRVRLAGIRAPVPGQASFESSRVDLVATSYLRSACVRPLAARDDGSLVATVRVGGSDLARRQLGRGFAWLDPASDPEAGLQFLADRAATERAGLWASEDPESPWAYEARLERERRAKQPTPTPSLVELAGPTRFADPKNRRIVMIASPTPTTAPAAEPADDLSTLSLSELLEALGPLEIRPAAQPTPTPPERD